MLLEVIVQSVSDAREAARGGADRLEVVRNLEAGGLTPPHDLVRDIAAEVSLPLRVMVRDNDGYSTHAGERTALADAAARFADLGVDGIVIGFARGGQPQIDRVIDIVPAARQRDVSPRVRSVGRSPWRDRDAVCGGADRSDPDERRRRQPHGALRTTAGIPGAGRLAPDDHRRRWRGRRDARAARAAESHARGPRRTSRARRSARRWRSVGGLVRRLRTLLDSAN